MSLLKGSGTPFPLYDQSSKDRRARLEVTTFRKTANLNGNE